MFVKAIETQCLVVFEKGLLHITPPLNDLRIFLARIVLLDAESRAIVRVDYLGY